MNKRFYFILIPILSMLFSLNSKAVNIVSFSKPTSGFSITIKIDHFNPPYSLNLRNENSERTKYKVRIKAWDDASAADISCVNIPKGIFCYYSDPNYIGYSFSFRSSHLSKHSLRGPPVA